MDSGGEICSLCVLHLVTVLLWVLHRGGCISMHFLSSLIFTLEGGIMDGGLPNDSIS